MTIIVYTDIPQFKIHAQDTGCCNPTEHRTLNVKQVFSEIDQSITLEFDKKDLQLALLIAEKRIEIIKDESDFSVQIGEINYTSINDENFFKVIWQRFYTDKTIPQNIIIRIHDKTLWEYSASILIYTSDYSHNTAYHFLKEFQRWERITKL